MPTNLPPEYHNADERYRAAQTPEEKIRTLEDLISTIPKHKGTDKLRADLRRKLSKFKASAETRKGTGKRESIYSIDREGAGQIAVVGFSNTGKSSLVARLTNASPDVEDYPFSTWTPTPGMLQIDNIQVQLIDTPPLDRDFVEPELMDLLRRVDMILLMVDLQAFPIEQLEKSVAFLGEHRIFPSHLRPEIEPEGFHRNVYLPFVILVNKCDDEHCDEDFAVFQELVEGDLPLLPLSILQGRNLEQMKQVIYETLGIMRVYSKPPGKEADPSSPFVLAIGSTVEEFAAKGHQDFFQNLKSARIWGTGVHDGQLVGREHVLHEGDIVELRI